MAAERGRRQVDVVDRLQHQNPQEDTPSPQRPVVFVLPGLGGEEDPLLEEFWGPTRSMLDLVPVTYFDWTQLVDTGCDFSALAAHVKRQVEKALPIGPVRMAGYSIGGHLAYAIALELQAQGRSVEAVAILDAPASVSDFIPPLRKRVRARIHSLLAFNFPSGLASFLAKFLIMRSSRPLLRRFARYRGIPLPFQFERHLHHKITMQLVRRIYPKWWQATLREASPLLVPAFLFRSEEHQPSEREDLGWLEYCPRLKVVAVPGSHRDMLEPPNNLILRAAFIEVMTLHSGRNPEPGDGHAVGGSRLC